MRTVRVTLAGFGALLSLGCSSEQSPSVPGPSAAEVWPDAPQQVPVITQRQIETACEASIVCYEYTADPELARSWCEEGLRYAIERAIPMRRDLLKPSNERGEFWVSCVLAAQGDCAAIAACSTAGHDAMYCEEDGCKFDLVPTWTCVGDVAQLLLYERSFTRDCSRAYARCDSRSVTGCTDRHFTRCPEGSARADRCDGNIRLGCDKAGFVSYRDCSRLGGTCGKTTSGDYDCKYDDYYEPP